MSDTTQYTLSCHCQAHVYLLTLPTGSLEFEGGAVCDCSFCLKRRVVWKFVPKNSLVLHRNEGELKEYRHGSKTGGHRHCGTCGTYLMMEHSYPGVDQHFINLRAVRNPDFDLWKLPLDVHNGAVRDLPYAAPTLSSIPGALEALTAKAETMEGPTEIYAGSCHCQAITFCVVLPPLHSADKGCIEPVDCACSICLGNGALWAYPPLSQVIFSPSFSPSNPHRPSEDAVTRYAFGKGTNGHFMCKVCGCHIYEHREGIEDDMGLNVALFSRAGEWMRDVSGLRPEGKEQLSLGKEAGREAGELKGLYRNDKDRESEPKYEVRL